MCQCDLKFDYLHSNTTSLIIFVGRQIPKRKLYYIVTIVYYIVLMVVTIETTKNVYPED